MKKYYQKNERIRAPKLRVIKDNGENLGEIDTKEALTIAKEEEKDLVVIVEKANPPVAKILDFNKFLYDEKKKFSAAKAKSKKSELKELRFGPNVGQGDLNQRVDRAREFIEDNHRVQFTVHLRGRQRAFPDVATEKLIQVAKALEDIARPEGEIKRIGNRIIVTFIKN